MPSVSLLAELLFGLLFMTACCTHHRAAAAGKNTSRQPPNNNIKAAGKLSPIDINPNMMKSYLQAGGRYPTVLGALLAGDEALQRLLNTGVIGCNKEEKDVSGNGLPSPKMSKKKADDHRNRQRHHQGRNRSRHKSQDKKNPQHNKKPSTTTRSSAPLAVFIGKCRTDEAMFPAPTSTKPSSSRNKQRLMTTPTHLALVYAMKRPVSGKSGGKHGAASSNEEEWTFSSPADGHQQLSNNRAAAPHHRHADGASNNKALSCSERLMKLTFKFREGSWRHSSSSSTKLSRSTRSVRSTFAPNSVARLGRRTKI